MRSDRAKHAVLPISKFGLMQITRQRMKPEMNINTQEVCPTCNGTGKIASTLILEDEIEKNLNYLIIHKHRHLTLIVHPIVYAYLTKGWMWSKASKWKRKFKEKITASNKTGIIFFILINTKVISYRILINNYNVFIIYLFAKYFSASSSSSL